MMVTQGGAKFATTFKGKLYRASICLITGWLLSLAAPAGSLGPVQVAALDMPISRAGDCTVEASVDIPGMENPVLSTNTTKIITLASLDLAFKDTAYLPPAQWLSSQHVMAITGVPQRIFK